MIAHRLKTIQNANQICVFVDGNIIEQGTHATLMSQKESKYRQLVEAQETETKVNETDSGILEIQHNENQDGTSKSITFST